MAGYLKQIIERIESVRIKTESTWKEAFLASPGPTSIKKAGVLSLKGMCMGAADVIPGVSGGTIALVEEGDSITIDANKRLLQLKISAEELARRRAAWQPVRSRYTTGVLAKYAKLVSSSSLGAVTDLDLV